MTVICELSPTTISTFCAYWAVPVWFRTKVALEDSSVSSTMCAFPRRSAPRPVIATRKGSAISAFFGATRCRASSHRAEATALVRTLSALGMIETRNLMAIVDEGAIGANVRLSGGTFAERKLFADAMAQLSGEIRNARYLIAPAHQVRIRGIFCAQSVPDVIGTRRENVDEFIAQLDHVNLPMRAVYTRNSEGRAFLLRARKLSGTNIAARLTNQTRRYDRQLPATALLQN